MAKFRTAEEKTSIIKYLLTTRPNSKDRAFEITNEELLAAETLVKLFKYDLLWNYIDQFIGKPLDETKISILWNKIIEAIHYV